MRISLVTERKKVVSYLVKMIWTLPLFLYPGEEREKECLKRLKNLLSPQATLIFLLEIFEKRKSLSYLKIQK